MISRDDLNPAQPRDFPSAGNLESSRSLGANARLAIIVQPIASLLAAGFVVIAGWKEWTESSDVLLQRIAIASALFFFVLRLFMGNFQKPRKYAHATATIIMLGAVAYPITSILLTNTPLPTSYVGMALVLAGCIYASRLWFFLTGLLVAAGWTAAALPLLQGENGKEIIALGVVTLVGASSILEIRLRKFSKYEKGAEPQAKALHKTSIHEPATAEAKGKPSPPSPAQLPWCPVCKSSRDAIIRHNGDFILDANPAATSLLGMGVEEIATLPVVGIFSDDRRDGLAPVLRFGNFEPLETVASGFKDEAIPVEILNGALTMEQNGLKALLIRDLRKQEEAKRAALTISRRAQQAACRLRDLATLANDPSHESLEAFIRALAKSVHRWLPCTIGCFAVLWDNQAQGFSVLASSAGLPLQPKEVPLGEALDPLVGWLADRMETLVVDRVGEDEFGIRKLYPHEPVNSFCAVPLKNAAGMMGFLLVLERSHRDFPSEDLDYLSLVSHCASTACNEAMLHAQLNQSNTYEQPTSEQSPE